MKPLDVKIKLLRPDARPPIYSTPGSAGADLFACEGALIPSGGTAKLPTGIAVECDDSDFATAALIYIRSSLGTKHGVTLANSVGVVDSDYRGELSVTLINHGAEPYRIEPGDRIAQVIFTPVYTARFVLSDDLGETSRGDGGFGSTGR